MFRRWSSRWKGSHDQQSPSAKRYFTVLDRVVSFLPASSLRLLKACRVQSTCQ